MKKWQSKDGMVTLYLEDCREVLPRIGVADCVVSDPPYGVGLKARVTKHTTRAASVNYFDTPEFVEAEIIPRFSEYLSQVGRACITPGVRMLQRYPKAADIGGVFQPNGAGCGPWGLTCFHPVLFYGKCPFLARGRGSRPTSIKATSWKAADVDHPCPKPVAFMRWMVERSTWPGETVVDPFTGSGTCAIACIETGRTFIGVEKDPHYFTIAVARIKEAIKQQRRALAVAA